MTLQRSNINHDLLQSWIQIGWGDTHVEGFFSSRYGGVSRVPYASLNIGYHVGDDPDAVLENRKICAASMGIALDSWIIPEQVHGNLVAVVNETQRGAGAFHAQSSIAGVDGLITNQRNLALVIMAADCVPILLYDPVEQVIAAVHSGWKGTKNHIVVRTIERMKQEFSCLSENIRVALGPSIRRCCYEVDVRVANEMRKEFGNQVLFPRFGDKQHFLLSLQHCIRLDLLQQGVHATHITDCGRCTSCQTTSYFSHRRENGQTGRLLGAIVLRGDSGK